MIPIGVQGFEKVGISGLLTGLAALPALSRHLEHEIGARTHRANVHLDRFGPENGSALDWLIDVCIKTFTPTGMTIWSRDEGNGALRVAAFRPAPETASRPPSLKLGQPLSHVLRHRAGIRFDLSPSDHSKAMLMPMFLGRRMIGVVHLQRADHEFGEDELETLSLLNELFTLGCFLAIHHGEAVHPSEVDGAVSDGTKKAA